MPPIHGCPPGPRRATFRTDPDAESSLTSDTHGTPPAHDSPPVSPARNLLLRAFVASAAAFLILRNGLAAAGLAGVSAAEWVGLLLFPVLILRLRGVDPWSAAGVRSLSRRSALGAALVGAAGPSVAWLVYWAQSPWVRADPGVVAELTRGLVPSDLPGLAVLLLAAAVTPAICEEYGLRGLLLQGLRHWVGAGWAVVLSAMAFGLLHWSPGAAFRILPTAALGLLLGWTVLRSGSLLGAMVVHLTHNLLILVGSMVAGSAALAEGSGPPPAPFLLTGVAFVVLGGHLLAPPQPDPSTPCDTN
ncbi:MAG: CPBP family intramembrane metalloprotease [Gemmatimonadales bacterium]|nr:MAG: CPBP family intramembrane metalloprotease [Gemmatimonadales bacterium]